MFDLSHCFCYWKHFPRACGLTIFKRCNCLNGNIGESVFPVCNRKRTNKATVFKICLLVCPHIPLMLFSMDTTERVVVSSQLSSGSKKYGWKYCLNSLLPLKRFKIQTSSLNIIFAFSSSRLYCTMWSLILSKTVINISKMTEIISIFLYSRLVRA